MNIFKFKLKKIETSKEVSCVTLWRVSWNILKHKYGKSALTLIDSEIMYKVFIEKKDATDFIESLESANKILQNETHLLIELIKLEEEGS